VIRGRAMIAPRRRGFTLVEVLVALAILLAGIIAVVQLFPVSLEASNEAVLKGNATVLAEQKVEELRRDRDRQAQIIQAVRNRNTPTDPVVWPMDERLTYSYSGVSVLFDQDTPGNPADDVGVARVIVRVAPEFDPNQRVLVEMRFDQ